jgi:hypothetical protein
MTAEEDLPEALKKTVMGSRELRMCQSRGRARSAWWLKTVKVSLVLTFICTHKQDRHNVIILVISEIILTVKSPTISAIFISTPGFI